jgi:hypothetical protein
MKKTLLILLAIPVFLFSCKKDNTLTKTSAKKYKVNFNVTNFASKQNAFALRRKMGPSGAVVKAPSYIVDVLHYIVYDNQDNTLEDVVQDSTMSNFGIITDSLPAGTYTVTIVAGKKGLVTRPGILAANDYSYGGNSWQDTFFGSFTINIGTGNISADVTLSRVVGKLEVTLTDNIPANADSLIIATNQEVYGQDLFQGFFGFGAFINVRFAVAIPDSSKGKPNFTIDRLIGNCTSQFPLEIICKAADNTNIASTTVQNVNVLANQKVIVSGDLFSALAGHNSQQQFTTKIDTAWGTATTQSSFSLRTQKPGNH